MIFYSVAAGADGNPAVSQVPMRVPYSGVLEMDGVAMSGAMDMEVALFDAAASGTVVWTETQNVSFHRGRFAVELGSTSQTS
ncbi:MAG: hypothetical protein ABIJ09_14640 [Pseudomonadota bacterium]